MTLDPFEKAAIQKALREKRILLDGDPAAILLDVAEGCLHRYNTEVHQSLGIFERRIQDALSQNLAEVQELKNSSKQLATAFADLTRRVNNMDIAATMGKIVQDTYEKECLRIAYLSTERGYAYARDRYEKQLDRSIWTRGKAICLAFAMFIVATCFGILLVRFQVL